MLQQRVGDGEDHRAQEQAEHPEGEKAANDAKQDQQQRQIGPPLDQDGPQEVVHQHGGNADDDKYDTRHGLPRREQPDDGRQNHKDRADLRKAQNQGNGRQEACLRHTRRRQGNAGSEGLRKRCQDNAECDAAYRSPRQDDNLLAALVGQPPSKELAPVGRQFTLGIKNGGNADRQEKVQHRPSEASGSRDKPFRDGPGIGTDQLNDVLRAALHQGLPFFGNRPTHQWNIGQPWRR